MPRPLPLPNRCFVFILAATPALASQACLASPEPVDSSPPQAGQPVPTSQPLVGDPGPAVLSAYLGMVNAPLVPFCPGGGLGGVEGMPVVLSRQIYNPSLVASAFSIATSDGRRLTPSCVTLAPAGEEDEDSTVLLTGDFVADTATSVSSVSIVGPLLAEGEAAGTPGASLQGLSISTVTPVTESTRLVRAYLPSPADSELGASNGCPSSTIQVVRTLWIGGLRVTNPPAPASAITVRDHLGRTIAGVTVSAAEQGDNDNVLDLCLPSATIPGSVAVAASTYTAPNGLPNPATSVIVR
jgi:hypothetical protein